MQSLNGALPGLAALGAIGGASGVPGPTDTRARSHHDKADLSADGPRQPATGFIHGGSDKSGDKLIPVTNAIERLHEEFKRRTKTQTVLPSAETAAMLFWALLASGQITMRKVDGWQSLGEPLAPPGPVDLAA